jgi:hypothetical protein
MKAQQMWDVWIMSNQSKFSKKPEAVSTPYYNLPYPIARFKARQEVGKLCYQKGTFYVLVKNGEKPIQDRINN